MFSRKFSRKKRRSFLDDLLDRSLFDEIDEIFESFEKEKVGEGYSITVTQTPQGTKVHAKADNNIDINELRRRLEQQYPGAQIEIEGGKPLIREISTRPVEEKESKKETNLS